MPSYFPLTPGGKKGGCGCFVSSGLVLLSARRFQSVKSVACSLREQGKITDSSVRVQVFLDSPFVAHVALQKLVPSARRIRLWPRVLIGF